MLLCRTAYEALHRNGILYTKAENTSDLADHTNLENGNNPKKDNNEEEETDRKLNFSSEKNRNEECEMICFGEEEKDKDKNDSNEGKTMESFREMQKADDSLKNIWVMANNNKNAYIIYEGIFTHAEKVCDKDVKQVLLPLCTR